MNFDTPEFSKFNKAVELHDMILDINEESYSTVLQQIIHDESGYFDDQYFFVNFISYIFIAAYARPNKINWISKLLYNVFLQKENTESNIAYDNILFDQILIYFTGFKKYEEIACFILASLLNQKLITFNHITKIIEKRYNLNEVAFNEDLMKSEIAKISILYYWFYPEIEEGNLELFTKMKEIVDCAINSLTLVDYRIHVFLTHYFTPSNSFNKDLYYEHRNNFFGANTIEYLILNDSIEALQNFLSSEKEFDMNKRISPSLFFPAISFKEGGPTLIQFSMFCGSLKTFKYFYLNGSRIDIENEEFNSSFYAVAGGNIEIIRILKQHPDKVSFRDAEYYAIDFFQYHIFQWLVENNEAIDLKAMTERHQPIIHFCCKMNYLKAFMYCINYELQEYLKRLDKITSIENYADTPDGKNMIKVFINELMESKDDSSNTLFLSCVAGNSIIIMNFILAICPTVNIAAKTTLLRNAFHIAASEGCFETMKYLIHLNEEKNLIDINAQSKNGETPLISAIIFGKIDIIRLLLDLPNCRVDIASSRGPPLHFANKKNYAEIKALIERKLANDK